MNQPALIRRIGTFNNAVKLTLAKWGISRPTAHRDRIQNAISVAGNTLDCTPTKLA